MYELESEQFLITAQGKNENLN